eukprot:4378772-Prymnesium_polylepis.1
MCRRSNAAPSVKHLHHTAKDLKWRSTVQQRKSVQEADAPTDAATAARLVDLFYFADWQDRVCLFIGATGMTFGGVLTIISNIIFGDSFKGEVGLDGYKKTAFNMLYLGLAMMTSVIVGAFFIDRAKYRQLAEWKKGYLKAILRQDVGWYDVNKPEELSSRMGESLVLIEKGLG